MLNDKMLKFLREIAKQHGYNLVPRGDQVLSWNRTLPVPKGVDFGQEALDKIRAQITLQHLQLEEFDGIVRARLYLG